MDEGKLQSAMEVTVNESAPQEPRGDEPEEARVAAAPREVYKPSAADIAAHRLTHLPFRPWCPECCAGKGVNEPHHRVRDRETREFPQVSADYMFMTQKCSDGKMQLEVTQEVTDKKEEEIELDMHKQIKILIVKDENPVCLRAHRVPQKGHD